MHFDKEHLVLRQALALDMYICILEISNERRRTSENEDRSTPSVSASAEDERMAKITTPAISHDNDINRETAKHKRPKRPEFQRTISKILVESLVNKFKENVKEKKRPKPESSQTGTRPENTNMLLMSSKAAENLIKGSPLGTWILRINENGEKRITFLRETVVHIRLYEFPGELFSAKPNSDDRRPLQSLLREMQDSGTIGKRYEFKT